MGCIRALPRAEGAGRNQQHRCRNPAATAWHKRDAATAILSSLGKKGIGIALDENGDVVIDCTTRVEHRTGIEMEALTGASIAALTVYDMCKALSHDIVIAEIRLVTKTGGKSDFSAVGSS